MPIYSNQIVTRADWVKIGILLVIAIIAWYHVFTVYSQPLELTNEIKLQQIHQQYENSKRTPIAPAE